MEKVKFEFGTDFNGYLEVANGRVEIGKDAMSPYNLLFGALGSCLYYTFADVAKKKRLEFTGVSMEIDGTKRTTAPATLEHVQIKLIVKGASDEKQFIKTAEIASKWCSIHETISQVATIDMEVLFE